MGQMHVEHLPRVTEQDGADEMAAMRSWVAERTGAALRSLSHAVFTADDVRGNVENVIGAAQLPVGVAGPLVVNGEHARGVFYVPFATTEGTLVATYLHGMRAVAKAGGVNACVVGDQLDISPVFVTRDMASARAVAEWTQEHVLDLREAAESTTRHGRLIDIHAHVLGRETLVQFAFSTGDAMGMNMVNIAVARAAQLIADTLGVERWYLLSNYSSDKKPAAINLHRAYGKEVLADVRIPGYVVRNFLGATAEQIVDYVRSAQQASMHTGMLGFNAHFANGLAAIYIACGQDAAQVVNASIGFVTGDVVGDGDLYASVRLPNIVVGTVGGGTGLPTQRECLALLDCAGEGRARKFAEIVGATLLCGELGIGSALANGRFAKAHEAHRRLTAPPNRTQPKPASGA